MTIEEAAKILHDYQRWRRGVTDLLRPTNKEIGEAIDEAIRIMRIVAHANGQANAILQRVNDGKRVRQYTDMFEYTYNEIQTHVLLKAPERAYNIVRALTRLFVEAFDAVGIRTKHIYLRDAAEVLKRLDIPHIQDHNIDVIIQRNVEIVLPE